MIRTYLIAGNSLEPFCYNMGCKTECECLKSEWIGQSASKFLLTIFNYRDIMLVEKGSTTIPLWK